jgi:hypothetical protein
MISIIRKESCTMQSNIKEKKSNSKRNSAVSSSPDAPFANALLMIAEISMLMVDIS